MQFSTIQKENIVTKMPLQTQFKAY